MVRVGKLIYNRIHSLSLVTHTFAAYMQHCRYITPSAIHLTRSMTSSHCRGCAGQTAEHCASRGTWPWTIGHVALRRKGDRAAAADGRRTVPLWHFCGTCPITSVMRRWNGASGGGGKGTCSHHAQSTFANICKVPTLPQQ
jgi:hypothetical protein